MNFVECKILSISSAGVNDGMARLMSIAMEEPKGLAEHYA
jgi:hypothetical protein